MCFNFYSWTRIMKRMVDEQLGFYLFSDNEYVTNQSVLKLNYDLY